ncbi:MAG: hypothetical protein FWC76_01775 [Defluviitaleaceae bacterium]|nr:hypothetical protein [Defluviitaleaceae bacterium]
MLESSLAKGNEKMMKIARLFAAVLVALVLAACNGYVYEEDDPAEEIVETPQDGELPDLPEEVALEAEFLDLNFNGHMDKRIPMFAEAPGRYMPYYFWIWNEDLGDFVFNETLTQLSWENDIELEVDRRRLSAVRHIDDYGGLDRITLEYIDGDFVATSQWAWQAEETDGVRVTTNTTKNLLSGWTRFFNFVSVQDANEVEEFNFTLARSLDGTDSHLYFDFTVSRIHPLDWIPSPGDFLTHLLDIEITDASGALVQRIEGVEGYFWTVHVSFVDFNFDGYLDMIIHKGHGGNRWSGPQFYWLWDATAQQFVYNAQLSELSADGLNLDANPATQQIEAWMSSAAGRHYTFHDWVDGTLVAVSTFQWVHETAMHWAWHGPDVDFPEEYTTMVIRRDLISGEEEIWFEYFP